MAENNNGQKQFYDKITVIKALSPKTQAPYPHAITSGFLFGLERNVTPGGKDVVKGKMALRGVSKRLKEWFPDAPIPESEETTWLNINFWGEKGKHIEKFLGDRKSVGINVNGELRVSTYKKKDDTTGYSIELNVYDWEPNGFKSKNEGTGTTQPAKSQPQNNNAPAQQAPASQSNSSYQVIDEGDGDLPF